VGGEAWPGAAVVGGAVGGGAERCAQLVATAGVVGVDPLAAVVDEEDYGRAAVVGAAELGGVCRPGGPEALRPVRGEVRAGGAVAGAVVVGRGRSTSTRVRSSLAPAAGRRGGLRAWGAACIACGKAIVE
jgi:hypothetical protein